MVPQDKLIGAVVDSRGQRVRIDELTVGFNDDDEYIYLTIVNPAAPKRPRQIWVNRADFLTVIADLFGPELKVELA